MINFAAELVDGGWCYTLPSGLYFDTSNDPDYGRIARLNVKGQREGARVEVVEGKRNASDFAVWRTSAPDENRQMEWDSQWGRGAPGWHLECSVMSIEYLGRHFDIHTGGVDHIPVHHSNEIAQSDAYLADDQPWVGWWLHGDFINLKGAKISKSTGGGILITDLIERGYHPLVYRYLLLQAHYRSQVDFSWAAMDSARSGLRRLLDRYASACGQRPADLKESARSHLDRFDQAVSDNLNTPMALATVEAASRDHLVSDGELAALAARFDSVLAVGLTDLRPGDLDLKPRNVTITDEEVDHLVAARSAARAAKDFAESDVLREQLASHGVIVEDHPGGRSSWRWSKET
jgi:cysteinyl-tRNA synthetase